MTEKKRWNKGVVLKIKVDEEVKITLKKVSFFISKNSKGEKGECQTSLVKISPLP